MKYMKFNILVLLFAGALPISGDNKETINPSVAVKPDIVEQRPQRAGRPDARTKKNQDPKVREAVLVQRGQAKVAREKATKDFGRTNGPAGARLHQSPGNLPATPLNAKLPSPRTEVPNRSGAKGQPDLPNSGQSTPVSEGVKAGERK